MSFTGARSAWVAALRAAVAVSAGPNADFGSAFLATRGGGGDHVWYDANSNSVYDPGDQGMCAFDMFPVSKYQVAVNPCTLPSNLLPAYGIDAIATIPIPNHLPEGSMAC